MCRQGASTMLFDDDSFLLSKSNRDYLVANDLVIACTHHFIVEFIKKMTHDNLRLFLPTFGPDAAREMMQEALIAPYTFLFFRKGFILNALPVRACVLDGLSVS